MEQMEAAARQLAGSRLGPCGRETLRRIRKQALAPGPTGSWSELFAAVLVGMADNFIGRG